MLELELEDALEGQTQSPEGESSNRLRMWSGDSSGEVPAIEDETGHLPAGLLSPAASQALRSYRDSFDNSGALKGFKSLHYDEGSGTVLGTLPMGDSVYEGSLLLPLILGPTPKRYFTWCSLLAVNAFLQLLVLMKVDFLAGAGTEQTFSNLFELCRRVEISDMPFARRLEVQPRDGEYWDCAPGSVTAMSITGNLDVDRDGYWTMDDAESFSKAIRGKMQFADMTQVFTAMSGLASNGELEAQKGRDFQADARRFRNFTSLPMDWLAREEDKMALCAQADPTMCSNMEARRVLQRMLPGVGSKDERIDRCEHIASKYCNALFGERYKLHVTRTSELCGQRSVKWMPQEAIPVVIYQVSDKYVNAKDGVVRPQFIVFLFVIVMIWLLAMWKELRELYYWWSVLPFFPSQPAEGDASNGKAFQLLEGADIVVEFIPFRHKVWTLTCNLLPRTIIWAGLSTIGTKFLIRADTYTDLIFNSVALGFLIEIDNMLYAAVVADSAKRVIQACPELCLPSGARGWFDKVFAGMDAASSSLAQVLGILIVAGMFITGAYFMEGGKYDLAGAFNCLCQAAGHQCVPAQIVGGLAHLPDFTKRRYMEEG